MESIQQKKGVDAFALKIIAIVGMTLDHAGTVFGPYIGVGLKTALFALGGLTFPIMAYLLGEGYRHTRDVKKYALRLLIFAVITQLPYSWALYAQFNVLFTLLIGLLVLHLYETLKNRAIFYILLLLIALVSSLCDWGIVGPVMVLLYYVLKDQGWSRVVIPWLLPVCAMTLPALPALFGGDLGQLPSVAFVLVGCTLTIPLLHAYNGQRGKSMKYLFYAYYPVHIVLLGLLRGLIFGQW